MVFLIRIEFKIEDINKKSGKFEVLLMPKRKIVTLLWRNLTDIMTTENTQRINHMIFLLAKDEKENVSGHSFAHAQMDTAS